MVDLTPHAAVAEAIERLAKGDYSPDDISAQIGYLRAVLDNLELARQLRMHGHPRPRIEYALRSRLEP